MSATLIPSPDMRAAALVKANEVRFARSRLKAQLHTLPRADALQTIAGLIEEVPDALASMRVRELILTAPRVGEAKVAAILGGLSPTRKLGGLTVRQRTMLAATLRAMAARSRTNRARVPRCRCLECGEPMMRPSKDGRCGFCILEMN